MGALLLEPPCSPLPKPHRQETEPVESHIRAGKESIPSRANPWFATVWVQTFNTSLEEGHHLELDIRELQADSAYHHLAQKPCCNEPKLAPETETCSPERKSRISLRKRFALFGNQKRVQTSAIDLESS